MSSNMDPPPKQPAPSPLMQLTPADEAELAREASEVISLMDKGAINRDGIMLELRGDKHPLLFRHCVYGERESCTKKVMPIEGQMYRLHLQHAAFSGQLLQVFTRCEQQMFPGGQGGASTMCKWVSKEEVSELPPLSSLWWF